MGECRPIFKAEILSTTKSQNTNFFPNDLTPTNAPATFVIYFYPESGNPGFPYIKRTNGETTVLEPLGTFGSGSSYTLAPFMFQVLVCPGDSINMISPDGTAIIKTLIVIETLTPSATLFPTHVI